MEMNRDLDEVTKVLPEGDPRIKSASRMRYEAEVLFLKNQNGDLEVIRQKLGLSRRKICELLLVDPSAWTRWTQAGGDAPPHIHRALDWYLSIMEKDPEYRRLSKRFGEWLNHEKNHEGRIASLEASVSPKSRKANQNLWPIMLAFLGGALLTAAWGRL